MPRSETSQLVSCLRDKAGRAPDLSWTRKMHEAADWLEEQSRIIGRPMVHDYGWARGDRGLNHMLQTIDANGYELVCVTHVTVDSYCVFFRRPAP